MVTSVIFLRVFLIPIFGDWSNLNSGRYYRPKDSIGSGNRMTDRHLPPAHHRSSASTLISDNLRISCVYHIQLDLILEVRTRCIWWVRTQRSCASHGGYDQCYFLGLIWRPLPFFGLFRGHLTVPTRLRAVIVADFSALNPTACGHIGRQALSPWRHNDQQISHDLEKSEMNVQFRIFFLCEMYG